MFTYLTPPGSVGRALWPVLREPTLGATVYAFDPILDPSAAALFSETTLRAAGLYQEFFDPVTEAYPVTLPLRVGPRFAWLQRWHQLP